ADDLLARLWNAAGAIQLGNDVLKRRRPEVRHANRLQVALLMDGVDGNYVRVLQLSQCFPLLQERRRYLERHRAVGEVWLLCQEDSPEGAAAQFAKQLEPREHVAGPRHALGRPLEPID